LRIIFICLYTYYLCTFSSIFYYSLRLSRGLINLGTFYFSAFKHTPMSYGTQPTTQKQETVGRAQSPKNLYAATYLGSAQQSRVRSEHVRKELGGVLAPPIIFGRFLVGLLFRKQTTPFSWTASATCLDIVNRYTLFCVFSPTAINERCEAYVILIPYSFALCLLDINQVFQLFIKNLVFLNVRYV
jgi:hypothetical protein